MFSPDSRYSGTPNARYTAPDGRTFEYKRRRRIPRSEGAGSTGSAVAGAAGTPRTRISPAPDDRPDLLAARALGDPRLFWHLCDVNDVIDPDTLAEPGRSWRITPLGDQRR
jgi:hypothetical protein